MSTYDDIMGIIDVSSEHQDDFFSQEGRVRQLALILKQTNCLNENITRDVELYACGLFTEFVYATPIVDDFFYVFENEEDENKKSMLVFVSPDKANAYCEKYNRGLLFFRLDDLLTLKDGLGVEKFIFIFHDGQIVVDDDFVYTVMGVDFYKNDNAASDYEVKEVSSDYDKIKGIYNSDFKKYPIFKKMWLVHVKEYKDKGEYAENGDYEPEYDVLVADMPENQYINMREYLQSIVYGEKKKVIKVVLANSNLGKKFTNSNIEPFFVND